VHDIVTRDEKLEEALSRGASTHLPPNQPMGLLGDVGLDVRKTDDFEPTLNAGISQEDSPQLRWLLMFVLYLTFFGSPIALWLLWKEPTRSMRAKIISTVVGVAAYVIAFVAYGTLHG
jgi:hypothetical protein